MSDIPEHQHKRQTRFLRSVSNLFVTAKMRCAVTLRRCQRFLPVGFAFGLPHLSRGADDSQVAYRFEYYAEEKNRMKVETHSVYFDVKLLEKLRVDGELVYDGISGATPTGTHDAKGRAKLVKLKDLRRAGNIGVQWRFGNHSLKAGGSYSKEHDYLSQGVSVSDAIEFNEKNTILEFGVSHNFDSARDGKNLKKWHSKDSTDAIISLSQLLSPKDIFRTAFTFGNDSGYLTDPYRAAEYHPSFFPVGVTTAVPERRPAHRNKEILLNTWTHHFDSLNASLETSYRFYHDSYDVFAHTVGIAWYQRLGNHVILEPLFRFSEQSSASFYTTQFSGPFTSDPKGFHSSDYRLSNFYSLDYGLQITVIANDHLHFNAGYHRYEMNGLDHTSADMYPQANIFTIGIQFLW